jgi:putative ABC transport system ATP-binding protein
MPMIEIRDLEKVYRRGADRVVALRVADLRVGRGEHVAFVGPSGCGKTTLLHVISGLLAPDRGEVRVNGEDLFALGEAARDRFRARHIGYVHQTFNLLAPFTALENVALGVYFARGRADLARARELLERVGLSDRLDHRPAELSVGQQQRVAVARALVNQPQLLLADEPTGNQDPATGRQTIELMLSLAREIEATVLLVTHDPRSAEVMQRTVYLLDLAGAGGHGQ